jgi:hypothetical protein
MDLQPSPPTRSHRPPTAHHTAEQPARDLHLEPPEHVRLDRLLARHMAYGKDPAAARAWSLGSDQRNADLVAANRRHADLIVRLAA